MCSDQWILAFVWYMAEDDVAVICACLPMMKPLFSGARNKLRTLSKDTTAGKFRTEGVQAKAHDEEAYSYLERSNESKNHLMRSQNSSASELEKAAFAEACHRSSRMKDPIESDTRSGQTSMKKDAFAGDKGSRINAPLPALPSDGIRIKTDFRVYQETIR